MLNFSLVAIQSLTNVTSEEASSIKRHRANRPLGSHMLTMLMTLMVIFLPLANCLITDLVELLNKHNECAIFDLADVGETFENRITYRFQGHNTSSFGQMYQSESCIIAITRKHENLEPLKQILEKVHWYTIIIMDSSKSFNMNQLGSKYLLRPILKVSEAHDKLWRVTCLCANGENGLVNVWVKGKGLILDENPFKQCKHNLDAIEFKVGPAGYTPGKHSHFLYTNT